MDEQRASTVQVRVEPSCISSGICLAIAPEHFDFVGVRASPLRALVRSDEGLDLVEEAAEACPIGAISLRPVAPGAP